MRYRSIRSGSTLTRSSAIPDGSREDERDLAIRYREKGDIQAAYKLITANLRLVVKICHGFSAILDSEPMDLIEEGNIGLMQAAKNRSLQGIQVCTDASFWIKAT